MNNEIIDILRDRIGVDEEKIGKIQKLAEERGDSLPKRIKEEGILDEKTLLKALSMMLGLEVLERIPPSMIVPELVSPFSVTYLKQKKAIPLKNGERSSLIAVNDPYDYEAADYITDTLGEGFLETVLAPESEILRAINTAFEEGTQTAEQVLKDIDEEDSERIFAEIEETTDLLEDTSEAPVIKFVNLMLSKAVKSRASDIHIEPYQYDLKVRYRIDGLLYETFNPPKRLHPPITSRIKVMAGLNIAEKRVPQDGRIEIRIGDKNIDIRVSTLPTIFGERVVLRLLDKSAEIFQLHELGIPDEHLSDIRKLITLSHGIILVTGPTGSGKTTTLYAALSEINTPEKNIITIEDPVEYQISGIGQVHVNRKVGLTFANGLRTIVRQDPDVILVGEIRDLETAEIAIQAALTGHLVFSTLHTNDASSAVTRLIDMGIEPFLISSSVLAIIAQRLVRTICPYCKKPAKINGEYMKELNVAEEDLKRATLYAGEGCEKCMNTGYYGRTGIYEILKMSEGMKKTILTSSDANVIKKKAIREGMRTLRQDGAAKVLRGITRPEEVLRVTQV
ncbi:MAG: type II secretion system ATPase GspE [Deltaproteobacteria bacterium]|nr:type II secretion system ATPase GspE [Deltaproteobacteria bacterium]MBW2016427.1 type II secretion system ATPase GspE [Deltaproteobacteria bacterium]MBW2129845.1 type II secretion system ATPase GspE [Deltaproteobacteria bacterium]MBW2304109.1 type II secretion system ATPase GspE [Deltaproteobacteria bacterium]